MGGQALRRRQLLGCPRSFRIRSPSHAGNDPTPADARRKQGRVGNYCEVSSSVRLSLAERTWAVRPSAAANSLGCPHPPGDPQPLARRECQRA